MTLSEKWIDFFSSFSHLQIKPQPPLSQLLLILWNVVLYISWLGRSWKQSKAKQNSLRSGSFEADAEMVIFVLVSYWASSLEWETYKQGMGKSRRRPTPVGFCWSHASVCSHKKLQVVICHRLLYSISWAKRAGFYALYHSDVGCRHLSLSLQRVCNLPGISVWSGTSHWQKEFLQEGRTCDWLAGGTHHREYVHQPNEEALGRAQAMSLKEKNNWLIP